MCITKIQKLEQSLQSQEQYIKYLYATIDGYEAEIEELRCQNRNLRLSLKNVLSNISLKEEALQALEKQLADAENTNIQLKRRISELLQNSRKSKMSRHHTDPPEDLERMDSDELLTTIRNASMQMSIDIITKATTPDETRQARELRDRVVNSAWILYRKLSGDLDEALTQLGMELDENDVLQKENRANDELIGLMHNHFQRKQNKKRFWKTHYYACVRERNLYRDDKALLEYNRDQLYDRYLKWKQKTQAVRNDNHNLNQRIIALQNNPPVIIQNQGMAGYAPKKFRGLSGEDPLLWFQEFRQWVEASGIDVGAGGAGGVRNRARVLGVFETCMEDDARDWYESKIKGKNWELQNILDGIGVATLRALRALNNGAIAGLNANLFRGQASIVHGNAGVNNAITGHTFIPDETVWEEDWSIAGGRTTDFAPNAPNVGGGGTIVAPGLRAGQVFYEFRTAYTTITAEKSKVAFQSIVQGRDSVTRFYSNLRRMVKLAYPTLPVINQDELVRQQFLQGLSRENQIEARRIGLENPTSAILKKLEEIERYRSDTTSLPIPLSTPISSVQQGPSLDDVARLIDSKMQSLKHTTPAPAYAPAPAPQPHFVDQGKERMLMLAYRLGFPQPDNEDGLSLEVLENFIDKELRSRLKPDDYYHQTFQVKKVFGMNTSMYGYNAHADKPRKSSRKCSECGKSGHTKSSCPKKKKGKGKKKTNYVEYDTSSSDSTFDSSSSDDSDSDSHTCYGLKKKKDAPSKKKPDMKKPQLDKNRIVNEVFQLVLKTMVESFVNAVPKETVISIYNAMNAEFVKFKDPILSQLKGSPSIKTREKIWDSVKEIFAVILQPMISVVSNNLASNLIRKEEAPDNLHVDDSLWMPAGIGIVNRKSASDVITIKTKIIAPDSAKTMVVPKTIFDTGSDSSLVSSNIVKRLELDVDKTNAPDLSGVATKSDTMGTTYGLGISIYDSDNDKTIEDDFMVIKSDKDFLLLGVPWIDRAKAILDCGNRQLSIPISQRKKVIIPISLHKRKTNVTTLHIDSIDLKKIRMMEDL